MLRAAHYWLLICVISLVTVLLVPLSVLFGRSSTLANVRKVDSEIIRSLTAAVTSGNVEEERLRHVQRAFDALMASNGKPFYGLALLHEGEFIASNLTRTQRSIVRNGLDQPHLPRDGTIRIHQLGPDGDYLLAEFRSESAFDFRNPLAFVLVPLQQWLDPHSQDVNWSTIKRKTTGPAAVTAGGILLLAMSFGFVVSVIRTHKNREIRELQRQLDASRASEREKADELDAARARYEDRLSKKDRAYGELKRTVERLESEYERAVHTADEQGAAEENERLYRELERAEAELKAQFELSLQRENELNSEVRRLQKELDDRTRDRLEREQRMQHATSQGSGRRPHKLHVIWDPEPRWKTRARAEREGTGRSESLVVALLAFCAIDAALDELEPRRSFDDSFRNRLRRLDVLTRDERRFLSTAWDHRNALIHSGRPLPANFEYNRLWEIAERLSVRPITVPDSAAEMAHAMSR